MSAAGKALPAAQQAAGPSPPAGQTNPIMPTWTQVRVLRTLLKVKLPYNPVCP